MTDTDATLALAGQRICLSGRLASMTHAELAELIAAHGGECQAAPNRGTTMLVIGQDGWPLVADGQLPQSLQRARQLQAAGQAIEVLNEEEFLERLGLCDARSAIHRRYTIAQLSRLLKVSGARLRSWAKAGLIRPVETVHRLAYFDFAQVSGAKTVFDLVQSGVSLQQIRDALEQLRPWLRGGEDPLSQLSILERNGRLVVRLANGRLMEPGGQYQLDFSDDDAPTVAPNKSADDWFSEALVCEDAGCFKSAAQAYRKAIEQEPADPVLYFNLGNVLYMDGDTPGAAQAFFQAVERDAHYVEAWNNLGGVLVELGQPREGTRAYEQALRLMPTYADAHYNLADTLEQLGREQEAARHWRAVVQYDPQSPWAEEAQARLERLKL